MNVIQERRMPETAQRLLVIRFDGREVRTQVAAGTEVSLEVFEIYDWASQDQPMCIEQPIVAMRAVMA